MPSQARVALDEQIKDFDELMQARDTICPDGAGRPAKRQGAAIIRASVLMLAAAFEAYAEDVYEEAVDLIYANKTAAKRQALKGDTSQKMNNATIYKLNNLFIHLGISWIMDHPRICWQKFSNASVQDTLGALMAARNRNAHGRPKGVRKPTAVKWRYFSLKLADRIDLVVAERVDEVPGNRPW